MFRSLLLSLALMATPLAAHAAEPAEAALAEGRRWGMKSLEPAVRERLQARAGETP